MKDIGLVGLGLVGHALAQRLLAAGFAVQGFDLRPEARAALDALGGKAVAAVRDIRCERVVLAVFDTKDVVSVLGELGSLREPSLRTVIDCSTGDPEALKALAAQLRERGVDFIEGPLSRVALRVRGQRQKNNDRNG